MEAAEGRTYWQLVWGQFIRNRLAVAAGVVVWLMFTIAIFAPFIANGYPYYAKIYNPTQYRGDFRGWRLNHRELRHGLAAQQRKVEQLRLTLENAKVKLGQMKLQLAGKARAFASEIQAGYEALDVANPGDVAALTQRLDEQVERANQELKPDKVELVPGVSWPLLRQLHGADVGAMLAYLLAMLAFLIGPRIGLVGGRAFLIVVGASLMAALLWHALFPPIGDATRYHELRGQEGAVVKFLPVPYFPDKSFGAPQIMAPSWTAEGKAKLAQRAREEQAEGRKAYVPIRPHYLGTDEYGYDVVSRMVWGSRVSLSVGFVAVSIYVTIGILLGSLAGYFGGWTDILLSRLIEVVICFPFLFLVIIIMAYFPPSVFWVMVVIGVTGWPGVARLVRGEFLRLGNQEFVLAARALGIGTPRIIFLHMLPNAMAPVLVVAAFGIAGAILTESALSFLGIGVPLSTPTWGALLRSAQDNPRRYWWLMMFPGLAVFIAVTAYNLVAEGIRDAIDPKLKE